ncbi:MAG: hypothetical protein ACJ8AW_52385 [Rhodopila sp.]
MAGVAGMGASHGNASATEMKTLFNRAAPRPRQTGNMPFSKSHHAGEALHQAAELRERIA